MEFSLLGAAALAVGAIYAVLWWEGGRTNAADCTRQVWDGLLTALVVGLVAGRLAAMVTAGTNPLAKPGDILIVRGGVDTVAAAVAGLAAFAVTVRADLWRLADAAAPAATAGLAGWHAGCLVRDGCLGSPSGLPWALSQAGSEVTRHPVEIYTALLLVALTIALVLWKRARPGDGVIATVAMMGAAATRWLTEPLRPGLGADLGWWYAGGAIIAGVAALWRLRAGPPDSAG